MKNLERNEVSTCLEREERAEGDLEEKAKEKKTRDEFQAGQVEGNVGRREE